MLELVRTIVDQLVDDPSNVDINVDDVNYTITILVDKSEIGRVIGKQGRIAKAIRSIVRSAGMKHNVKYNVEIDERKI